MPPQLGISTSPLVLLRPLTLVLVLGTVPFAAAYDIIDRNDPAFGDSLRPEFGSSLAATNEFLLVGTKDQGVLSCPVANTRECYHGLTYVYDAVSHEQVFRWEGDAVAPPRNDKLGYVLLTSVGTNGEVAVVHERYQLFDGLHEVEGYAGGDVVHVYDLVTGQRRLRLAEIAPPSTVLTNSLGARNYYRRSVAVDGHIAVVGLPGAQDRGNNSGAALVIDLRTNQLLHRLVPEDSQAGDEFGWTVALSGQLALVNAPGDLESAAHVFDVISGEELAPIDAHAQNDGGTYDYPYALPLFLHDNIAWVYRLWSDGYQLDAIDLITRDLLYSLPRTYDMGFGVVTDGISVIGGHDSNSAFIADLATGRQLNLPLPELGEVMAMNEHSLYVQNVPYFGSSDPNRIFVYPKPQATIPEPSSILILQVLAITCCCLRPFGTNFHLDRSPRQSRGVGVLAQRQRMQVG